MKPRSLLWLLAAVLLLAIALFLLYGYSSINAFILHRRLVKLLAIAGVGCATGYATVVFQTITQNRILSPAVMGLESAYLFLQSLIVLLYGDKSFQVLQEGSNFAVSLVFMLLFTVGLYLLLFRGGRNDLYLLLLVGMTFGVIFNVMSSCVQMMLNPDEFSLFQTKMYASFNQVNTGVIWPALGVLAVCFLACAPLVKYLDVLSLGREYAIGLGLRYQRLVFFFLVAVSLMVAVSTALVGPMLFLGILVSNLTYTLVKTFRHQIVLTACCLLSTTLLLLGQWVVEHGFNFNTPVSSVINLVGGIYFLFLILRRQA